MDRLIIHPYWILKYQNEAKNAVFSELIIYSYWILNSQSTVTVTLIIKLIIYPYWILNMKKRIIFAGSSMCICQPKIRSTAH